MRVSPPGLQSAIFETCFRGASSDFLKKLFATDSDLSFV